MINLRTKFEVSTCTRYEAMNGGARCEKWGGLWWLGGTQGHGQCHRLIERVETIPFSRYSELFVQIQVADFSLPHLHLAPRWERPRLNFFKFFGIRKLESLGYHVTFFV